MAKSYLDVLNPKVSYSRLSGNSLEGVLDFIGTQFTNKYLYLKFFKRYFNVASDDIKLDKNVYDFELVKGRMANRRSNIDSNIIANVSTSIGVDRTKDHLFVSSKYFPNRDYNEGDFICSLEQRGDRYRVSGIYKVADIVELSLQENVTFIDFTLTDATFDREVYVGSDVIVGSDNVKFITKGG